MIDVGVAADEDDVDGIPAPGLHLRPRHRQRLGRAAAAIEPQRRGMGRTGAVDFDDWQRWQWHGGDARAEKETTLEV
jgi:hypothetical protein